MSKHYLKTIYVLAFLLMFSITGCSSAETLPEAVPEIEPTASPAPTEIPEITLVTEKVGTEGARLSLDDGASLSVPAGLSGEGTTISLERVGEVVADAPPIPEGALALSEYYDVRVESGSVEGGGYLTLPVDMSVLPGDLTPEEIEAGLYMAVPKDGYWLNLIGTLDAERDTYTAYLEDLGDPLMMWDFSYEEEECDHPQHACWDLVDLPDEGEEGDQDGDNRLPWAAYDNGEKMVVQGHWPDIIKATNASPEIMECPAYEDGDSVTRVLYTVRVYPDTSSHPERFVTLMEDIPLQNYLTEDGVQYWKFASREERYFEKEFSWDEEQAYFAPIKFEFVTKYYGLLKKDDGTCLEDTLIGVDYDIDPGGSGQVLMVVSPEEAAALMVPPPPAEDPCGGVVAYYEGYNSEDLEQFWSNVLTAGWGEKVTKSESDWYQNYFDDYEYTYTVNSCGTQWMSAMPPYTAILDTNINFYSVHQGTTNDKDFDFTFYTVWHDGKWKVARNYSQDDLTPLTIHMTNSTDSVVQVKWIDYERNERDWFELQPGETRSINTAATHIWTFYDQASGKRLLMVWLVPESEAIEILDIP